MPDEKLTCRNCGASFWWREKDEQSRKDLLAVHPGGYDPKDDCPSCRIKQDGMR